MKSFIKLTTAALALVTLASCSNEDDMFGNSSIISGEKTLQLNVEQMGGASATRSAYDVSNKRIWQEGDVFKAYDGELYKYDFYEFNKASNAFVLKKGTDKDLEEPQYVLFPSSAVKTTEWIKADKSVKAYMTLDATYEYADVAGENGTEYVSNLPLWGTAAADATYGVSADVYFMTGILKISLDNVPDNATSIEVTAKEDIAGTTEKQLNGEFVALLDKNNVKNVYLKSNADATDDNSKITVSLTEAGKIDTHSVIFLPIPAGHYGQLKVSVKKGGSEVYAKNYVDKDIERNKVYSGAKKSFEAAATNVNNLNTLLATFANSATGDAELEVSTETAVSAEVGNTVVVPTMKAESMTLNLKEMTATATTTLTFSGAYAGNFILNIPKAAKKITNIAINMPNANVTIASQLKSFSGGINLTDAKSVTFAGYDVDGTETDKNYSTHNIVIKAEVGDITIGSKAKVGAITLAANHRTESLTVEGEAGDITIAAAAAHPCNVVVSGTAGDINNKGEGDITISGYAGKVTNTKGATTISGYCEDVTSTEGDITISGDPIWNDARGGSETYAKTADVTAKKGDVTVDLTAGKEGAAVSGTLTFNSDATLTLNNGYIAGVTVTGTSGATVKVTNGAEGYTSLGTVTLTDGEKDFLKIQNASVWNGKNIGDGISKPGKDDTYDVSKVKTAYETYKSEHNIFTATEFAYKLQGNTPTTWQSLCNDINLNNKPFTPAVALNVKFVGNNGYKAVKSCPTISNLKIAYAPASDDAATAGCGLFQTATAAFTIKDIIFNNIAIAAAASTAGSKKPCDGIGALIGKVTVSDDASIENVTVSGTNSINATGLATNIGSLVGEVKGTIEKTFTIKKVNVSGMTITGYHSLGGLVGKSSIVQNSILAIGAAEALNTVGVSFTQTLNPAYTSCDPSLAKVGYYIGEICSTAAASTAVIADALKKSYIVTNETVVAAKRQYSVNDGDGQSKLVEIVRPQTLIGYTGSTTLTANLTIGSGTATAYIGGGVKTEKPASTAKLLDYVKNFE